MEATVVKLVDLEYHCDGKDEDLEDEYLPLLTPYSGEVCINKRPMEYPWELLPGNWLQIKKGDEFIISTSEIQDRIAILLGVTIPKFSEGVPVLLKDGIELEVGSDLLDVTSIVGKYFPQAHVIFSTKTGVYGIEFKSSFESFI